MLSVPKRLRYPLQADIAVQNLALHLFLSAVENCVPLAQRFKTSPPRRCGRLHPLLRGLNPHLHFHCVVVDGVFEAGADVDLPVRFHEASAVSPEWLNGIHAQVRQRLLRAFTCRGLLEADAARESPGNTAVDSASMPAHRSQRPIRL